MSPCLNHILLLGLVHFLGICNVATLTAPGEDVDDKFDFNGVPGVNYHFKVDIPAGREDCFFQYAKQNANLYVSYQVIRGGDRLINFYLLDKDHKEVDVKYGISDGFAEVMDASAGHYMICFDNTGSRFGSKLVYFFVVTVLISEYNDFTKDIAELEGLAVNMSSVMSSVELSLLVIERIQMKSQMNVIRDWYLISGNNRYIGYWSITLSALVIIAGAGQVYFLRRMFTVPNVTPSSKPRA